jgi:hypothetical protein
MYDFIDKELEEINLISKTKVWKTSPVREKHPTKPLNPIPAAVNPESLVGWG